MILYNILFLAECCGTIELNKERKRTMTDKKLRVALIGCGMIGHGHAEGIARDGRAEIVAVVYGKNKQA